MSKQIPEHTGGQRESIMPDAVFDEPVTWGYQVNGPQRAIEPDPLPDPDPERGPFDIDFDQVTAELRRHGVVPGFRFYYDDQPD